MALPIPPSAPVVLGGFCGCCEPCTLAGFGLVNTGAGLDAGDTDPNYSGLYALDVTTGGSDLSVSRAVSPYEDGVGPENDLWEAEFEFTVPGSVDPTQVLIYGRALADDGTWYPNPGPTHNPDSGIYLNGDRIADIGPPSGAIDWADFVISGLTTAGPHTVKFQIRNAPLGAPTNTYLRVEWTGVECYDSGCKACGTRPPNKLFVTFHGLQEVVERTTGGRFVHRALAWANYRTVEVNLAGGCAVGALVTPTALPAFDCYGGSITALVKVAGDEVFVESLSARMIDCRAVFVPPSGGPWSDTNGVFNGMNAAIVHECDGSRFVRSFNRMSGTYNSFVTVTAPGQPLPGPLYYEPGPTVGTTQTFNLDPGTDDLSKGIGATAIIDADGQDGSPISIRFVSEDALEYGELTLTNVGGLAYTTALVVNGTTIDTGGIDFAFFLSAFGAGTKFSLNLNRRNSGPARNWDAWIGYQTPGDPVRPLVATALFFSPTSGPTTADVFPVGAVEFDGGSNQMTELWVTDDALRT